MEASAELKPFPLLKLPLELRQQIHDYALGDVPDYHTLGAYVERIEPLPKVSLIEEDKFIRTTSNVRASEALLHKLLLTNGQVFVEMRHLVKKRSQ